MSATPTSADMKLEVDIITVANIERSKQFYERLGWRLDSEDAPTKDPRIVQFTAADKSTRAMDRSSPSTIPTAIHG